MARLKVRLRGKTISELPLSVDKSYIAGRKEDADICLQGDKGISREHFKLSASNDVWTVETLSRFGEILIGGERAENIPLEHGMTFAVPPYEFEFLMTSADANVASGVPGGEAPFTADVNAMIGEEFVPEKTVVGVAPSVPYIKIMDSQGEPKELIRLEGGDAWVAGRDSNCNIQIRDQRVSRRQFEVRKNGAQYFIIDLGSVNGTLVNGSPISNTGMTPLKSGDAITVLENYLFFELHDPNFKSRMELVSLQPSVPHGEDSAPAPLVPLSEHLIVVPPHGQSLPAVPDYPAPPVAFDPYGQQPPPPLLPFPSSGSSGHPLFDKKNRVKVIIGVLAIGFIGFLLMEENEPTAPPPQQQILSNDPFSKLTPEQKKLVKDTLQLAKSYYMQGKYELAKSELIKMNEFIAEYEDSKKLAQLAEEAIYVQQEQRRQEEMARNQKEQEEKIQAKVQVCRSKMTPDMTRDQMELCLEDVIAFNPGHPLFEELYGQIANYQAAKAAKLASDAAYQAEVARLKAIYGKAKALDKANKPLSAIKAYEGVLATKLPDPGGVRGVSAKRIVEIKKMINSKTETMQKESERLAHDGKLRDAILALRTAKQVDPQNPLLDEKIEMYKLKLQEEMMRYYQEGILDESFGNVDGDENKPGAKQKWRKILQMDIEDGEYYKKAYLKMKKYGVPK